MRGVLLVAGACLAVAAACTGCRGTMGSQQQPVPTAILTQDNAGGSDTSDGQPGSELDQLQSTLDSVQAQLNADSAP